MARIRWLILCSCILLWSSGCLFTNDLGHYKKTETPDAGQTDVSPDATTPADAGPDVATPTDTSDTADTPTPTDADAGADVGDTAPDTADAGDTGDTGDTGAQHVTFAPATHLGPSVSVATASSAHFSASFSVAPTMASGTTQNKTWQMRVTLTPSRPALKLH